MKAIGIAILSLTALLFGGCALLGLMGLPVSLPFVAIGALIAWLSIARIRALLWPKQNPAQPGSPPTEL